MGVARLLANVKSSRPFYKAPEDAGTPINDESGGDENEWDIIIVGGGSAGCVLAGRRVLLLDRGLIVLGLLSATMILQTI